MIDTDFKAAARSAFESYQQALRDLADAIERERYPLPDLDPPAGQACEGK
jgi:hypothetical protein